MSPKRDTLKDKIKKWWIKNRHRIVLILLIFIFMLVYLWNRIFLSIYPGDAGVLWKRFQGGTQLDHYYSEGYHIIFPFDEMYVYETRVQKISDTLIMLASNGLSIEVEYAARFFPVKETLPILHQNFGPEYVERVVRPEVVSAIRRVLGNYKPEDIFAKDEAGLLKEIADEVRENINPNYIRFHDVMLLRLALPESIQKAINAKLTQEQEALAYKFILEKEEQELDRRTIEGKGIQLFEEYSGISILKWRGIEATEKLATSTNAKFIVVGNDSDSLPVILNVDK